MTPEAQRIAIAKACGWTMQKWGNEPHQVSWITPQQTYGECPDYLTDLNVMHEVEKTLFEDNEGNELSGLYHSTLICVMGAHTTKWRTTFATAAQRAEAFLRTIGKWDDTK